MAPSELIPLVQPAAEAAKGFNWSGVIPTATGAVIALIGVGASSYVNYRIKLRELNKQHRDNEVRRIIDAYDKLNPLLIRLSKVLTTFYQDNLKVFRYAKILADQAHDYSLGLEDYELIPQRVNLYIDNVDEMFKNMAYTSKIDTLVSVEIDIISELRSSIIWLDEFEQTSRYLNSTSHLLGKLQLKMNAKYRMFDVQILFYREDHQRSKELLGNRLSKLGAAAQEFYLLQAELQELIILVDDESSRFRQRIKERIEAIENPSREGLRLWGRRR